MSRRWNSSYRKPPRRGWYEVKARDDRWDGETRFRAWGRGLWWIPLGDENGSGGWLPDGALPMARAGSRCDETGSWAGVDFANQPHFPLDRISRSIVSSASKGLPVLEPTIKD